MLRPLIVVVLSSLMFVALTSLQAQEEDASPLMRAWKAFAALDGEAQDGILARARQRLDRSTSKEIARLLTLRDRARTLEIVPQPPAHFYHPEKWTPGLYQRRLLDPSDERAQAMVGIFRPWESQPPIAARILYDFGLDKGVDTGKDTTNADRLWDLLYGYLPGADRMLAWLEATWDFDDDLDRLARHFAHAYCDLQGDCSPGVTLYDAFASREGMKMPDVDVIPYARLILNDDSYISPIPGDTRRQNLYDRIKDGFLKLFRHRTWIEAAANVYLNPEVELRPEHKPLRKRLLYAFYLDDGDVLKIRERFKAAGDRVSFIRAIDKLAIDDLAYETKAERYAARVNAARWEVARAAQDVLREEGLLTSGPAHK